MDVTEIRLAILAAPELQALLPDSQAIAAALSVGRTKVATRQGGIGAVMEKLGPDVGAQVLDGIKALSASVPSVRWAWTLVERGELDFGSSATRGQLEALRDGGSMTPEVCAALLSIALVPDPVSEMDVRRAIWNDDGTRAV